MWNEGARTYRDLCGAIIFYCNPILGQSLGLKRLSVVAGSEFK